MSTRLQVSYRIDCGYAKLIATPHYREESYAITIKEEVFPNPLKMQRKFDTTPPNKWKRRIYDTYNFHQPMTKIDVVFSTIEEVRIVDDQRD